MAAKSKKASSKKGKAPAKQTGKNRLDRLVDLQEGAVKYWGEYAQNAARLMQKGSMNPAPWMQEYTRLTRRVVQDIGDLMRIISGPGR